MIATLWFLRRLFDERQFLNSICSNNKCMQQLFIIQAPRINKNVCWRQCRWIKNFIFKNVNLISHLFLGHVNYKWLFHATLKVVLHVSPPQHYVTTQYSQPIQWWAPNVSRFLPQHSTSPGVVNEPFSLFKRFDSARSIRPASRFHLSASFTASRSVFIFCSHCRNFQTNKFIL